jgi:hypothetical protein
MIRIRLYQERNRLCNAQLLIGSPVPMIRVLTFGLLLVWLLGTACGSAHGVPPVDSPDTSERAAEQGNATQDEGDGYKNTLKWSTASEVDNFGFDIYRAESEDGPFGRLNDSPVPGAGTSDVPTYYEYLDKTIDPDRAYFYYIESISIHGEREKFTPTYRAAPKNADQDSENQD